MKVAYFVGRLTRDPVLRDTKSGKVCNFSLAVNSKFKRKNGEYDEQTDYFEFEAWGSSGEAINNFFKKGNWIIVHSTPRSYTTEVEGKKVSSIRFRVDRFDFPQWPDSTRTKTESKKAEETPQSEAAPEPEYAGVNTGGDDEVPF